MSPRSRTSTRKSRPQRFSPPRTARKSARFRSRLGSVPAGLPGAGNDLVFRLGAEPLAAAVAAGGDDATTTLGGHTGTETVPALADEFGRLVGTLHLFKYRGVRPFLILSLCNRSCAGLFWRDRNRAGMHGPNVSGLIERRVLEVNRPRFTSYGAAFSIPRHIRRTAKLAKSP